MSVCLSVCLSVSLSVLPMTGQALRKCWEVLRARYVFGYQLHDGDSWTEFEVALPPSLLLGSVTAGCLFDGLWCGKLTSMVSRFASNARSVAVHAFCTRAKDRGGSCEKFAAWEGGTLFNVNDSFRALVG